MATVADPEARTAHRKNSTDGIANGPTARQSAFAPQRAKVARAQQARAASQDQASPAHIASRNSPVVAPGHPVAVAVCIVLRFPQCSLKNFDKMSLYKHTGLAQLPVGD